jgi:DNA transposition AAA+ family ATPase
MNTSTRDRILQHIKESGKSQTKIAQEFGVSTPMLNQYLSGKYPNPESVEAKAEEFFRLRDKSVGFVKAPDYVETSISTEVYLTIQYCHVSRGIGVISGDAGIGKSKAALKYAQDYSEAIYITASKACKSLKDLYRMIARRLRINENRNLFDMQIDIRSRLDGSNKVIIIDEAQHLSITAIDGIRYFNDEDNENGLQPVGIVFIGNHELRNKMMGKFEQSLAQLYNRIQIQRVIFTGNVAEEDIKKLFPVYEEKSFDEEVKFLLGISQSKWGIRGAMKLFINASNNENITIKGLRAMAKYMGIGMTS